MNSSDDLRCGNLFHIVRLLHSDVRCFSCADQEFIPEGAHLPPSAFPINVDPSQQYKASALINITFQHLMTD